MSVGRNFNIEDERIDYRLSKLLTVQPEAVDIRAAGHCDVCRAKNSLVFYSLRGLGRDFWYIASGPKKSEDESLGNSLWLDPQQINGAFYCASCGFSNAGTMMRHEYEIAEILSATE
jgi:hypothetical protein